MSLHRGLGLILVTALVLVAVSLAEGLQCQSKGVTISVRKAADVAQRLRHPPTELVTLVVLTNPGPLRLVGSGYSCTVIRSRSADNPVTVVSNDRSPALYVEGASHVLVTGVNFKINAWRGSPKGCPAVTEEKGSKYQSCPAVYLCTVHNVLLTKGLINGRVDLWRAESSLVDSVTIKGFEWDTGLRIGDSGDGPAHRKSGTVISNNDISGSDNAIWLLFGAVGTSIVNNYIHEFGFSAIRCGLGEHNVGDCMLTTISDNVIYTAPHERKISDNTGIYFGTHWLNVGNFLSCNYVIGGEHCLYLDWASSGITIDGGVCHLNLNGLKLNSGHSNKVTSLIISSPSGQSGWISCQDYEVNNCLSDPGTHWESMRRQFYNSGTYQKLYPWLNNFCGIRSINGQNCNPRGSEPPSRTGSCSGLPTANDITLTLVNAGKYIPGYRRCEKVTCIEKINSLKYHEVSGNYPNFNKVGSFGHGDDFGVPRNSQVYRHEPNFKSCPKSNVGIKAVHPDTYYARL